MPSEARTVPVERSSAFSLTLPDEVERRRVRAADGLNPSGPPPDASGRERALRVRVPLQLLWHLRDVQAYGDGAYRISVPLRGGETKAGASFELQRILEQMWVRYPTSELSAATSLSVLLADGDPQGDGDHRLTIQLTVDPTIDRRVDGTQMARHLRLALEQLATG
ncbi:MAG: hypothetical protein Q7T55_05580 [Solirubrobacteraceae bacterium]|nr:hypothetical protein [Solirubrobacteraceae bacterium]